MMNAAFKNLFAFLHTGQRGIFLQLIVLSIFVAFVSGCKDDKSDEKEYVGNWIELSDYEGVPRSGAAIFVLDGKAYVGTGYDGTDRLTDFWKYDPAANNWTRIADFPGIARNGAVGFSANGKGYVGLGYDGVNKLKDFYEYDPSTNTWTAIPEFSGTARYGAVAFAINNKGYVGTGYDGSEQKDFWQYDPSSKQWNQINSIGSKRRYAAAFVIDNKAYVCTGVNNGVYENDLSVYDPSTGLWTKKRAITNVSDEGYDDDYNGITGMSKAAFTVNNKGYIATGGTGSAGTGVWEYDPSTDLWIQKTDLEASGRIEAVGFGIGSKGYITTGRSSSYYFDDLWGFKPDDEKVDLDKTSVVAP